MPYGKRVLIRNTMTDKLSDLVEEKGFEAVGSAPNAYTLAYHLEELQKNPEHKEKEWLILPSSQVRGTAPAYLIYAKKP